MWTYVFWKQAAERAVTSAAGAVAALIAADTFDAVTADWTGVLVTAGMAALASVLLSLGGARIGPGNSPSTVRLPREPCRLEWTEREDLS